MTSLRSTGNHDCDCMHWLRSHLLVVTTLIVTGHVGALATASAALCCLPHHAAAGEAESCPLHRAADENCSMTQCPMHGESSARRHDAAVPTAVHRQHHTAAAPANNCQLTCRDENLTPATLLGVPGFLPSATTVQPPGLVTVRLLFPFLGHPDHAVHVSVPPPRT